MVTDAIVVAALKAYQPDVSYVPSTDDMNAMRAALETAYAQLTSENDSLRSELAAERMILREFTDQIVR